MFNLLVESEKKILRKEYAWRRSIVYLLGLVGVVFVSLILLIPVYVVSYYKILSANIAHDTIIDKEHPTEQSYIGDIKRINGLLTVLKDTPTISTADLVEKIVDARPRGIKLISIAYTKSDSIVLKLEGIAGDRDGLRAFTKSLSEIQGFTVEELPISDFVRDTKIPFTINIAVKI